MRANPAYATLPDYSWLKSERAFRMALHEPDFKSRVVLDAGEGFYDIMLGWREDDGAIVFSDIGGQADIGWNPEEGHGSVWRLMPDDRLEAIVPTGNMGRYMPLQLVKAPPNFAPWGGHIFTTGQTVPGRAGATQPHAVFRFAPGSDRPEVFALPPNNGAIGGGNAGALMPGAFGRPGGPFDGSFFVVSYMNCTVYRVGPDGVADPFLTLDEPGNQIMPTVVAYAPAWWGDLAGELLLYGARGTSFDAKFAGRASYGYWRIQAGGALEAIDPSKAPAPLRGAVQAPDAFGPFGGHVFYVDEGPINLSQLAGCDMYSQPLPYEGRILRRAPDGQVHLFADNFQGSYTSLVFDGPRLIIGSLGKSYSSGDYHEPDSAIYEIRYTGAARIGEG